MFYFPLFLSSFSKCTECFAIRARIYFLHKNQMEYRLVKGFREGSELLYIPSEKMLYRFKRRRNKAKIFVCYQSILSKPTKKKPARNENRCDCNASIRVNPDGTCTAVHANHTAHNHHESILRDMEKSNSMKEKCRMLKNDFSEDAHKISARNIFQREIMKYVYIYVRPAYAW